MTTGEVIALIKALSGGGGSGGGVLVVNGTETMLDKTWQEIHDAMLSRGVVVQFDDGYITNNIEIYYHGAYVVYARDEYSTATTDGYPARNG